MDWIEYIVTYDKPASPTIDGSDTVAVRVVARTITSGISKALDIAKDFAGGREIVGVAFAQIVSGAEKGESSAAFTFDRCSDFLATAVSRRAEYNAHYVKP